MKIISRRSPPGLVHYARERLSGTTRGLHPFQTFCCAAAIKYTNKQTGKSKPHENYIRPADNQMPSFFLRDSW